MNEKYIGEEERELRNIPRRHERCKKRATRNASEEKKSINSINDDV